MVRLKLEEKGKGNGEEGRDGKNLKETEYNRRQGGMKEEKRQQLEGEERRE